MNKTKDGRIIDKRVKINKNILRKIIFDIKEKYQLTWKQFALKLGVVEQTLKHDWIEKGNTIPLSIFRKLLKISNYKISDFKEKIEIKSPFWGQKLNKKEKWVKIPNIFSKEFAEFYGILLGDGCICSNLKGFVITGDKILEREYYKNYISNLINYLFGSKPRIVISSNNRVIRAVFYSKKICKFLTNIGFPKGLKSSGKPEIPKFLTKDKLLLSYCIRGIMDTDGSLSSHPHSKIMIHLSIPNKDLRISVLNGLKKLSISPGEFNKGIMLYGKDKITLFKEKIGFSNPKNILKFQKFQKTGRVPSSKETETFLRERRID